MGDDTASASLSHAVWVAPFAVLAFIRHDDMTLRYFMVPTALHALAVAFDGLTGDIRATGLVSSPTAAGGWLAFGVAYLAYHRWGLWPALLLVAALTLTESRLAMLAVLVVVCGLAAAGRVRWRVALPMCIAALTLAVVVSGSYSPKVVITNLENRLEMPRAPSLLPGGYFTERDMATSVPLRLSLELGYVGALLWLVLSGVALRGRRDVSWWALVALLLLSTLDVYTWVGSLAPLWWALLGMRLNGATTALSPAAALVSASSPAQGRGSLHATPSMPTLSPQAQSQRLHRQ